MIVVITSLALASIIQNYQATKDPGPNEFDALRSWLKEHNCEIIPTFPGTDSRPLQTYFRLHADAALKKADLKSLMNLPGIESVFEKPSDDLPG